MDTLSIESSLARWQPIVSPKQHKTQVENEERDSVDIHTVMFAADSR
jgi:hypothetical protein